MREYDIRRAARLVTLKLIGLHEVVHALASRLLPDGDRCLRRSRRDRPYPGSTTVTTVNGGVTGLVHTLAVELAPVRVNGLHPASSETRHGLERQAGGGARTYRRTHADGASRCDGRRGTRCCSSSRTVGERRQSRRRRRTGSCNDGAEHDERHDRGSRPYGSRDRPERVLQAGFPLTVYNRTQVTETLSALGAEVAEDTAGLLPEGGVCLTVISDDAALEMVTCGPAGVLDSASAGGPCSNAEHRQPRGLVARRAGRAGLRCRVPPRARQRQPDRGARGNLTIIVSGPAGALERTSELLTAIGPTIYHVGDGEQARVVKLALQVLIGGTAELLSEALLLGESGGVDRRMLLEVIGSSAAGSPFVKYKTGPLVAGDFSPTFTTRMLAKDVDLVLGFARQGERPCR